MIFKEKRADYNIEYAHIYADEYFGEEQIKSIKIAKEIIKRLDKLRKSYTLSILIDEYHPIKPKIDIHDFLKFLEKNKLKPDYVAMESKMAKDSIFLFKNIQKNRLKKEYKKYLETRKKSPCSLLTAIWYLKRLGKIKISENDFIYTNSRKPFIGKKLINILPRKYKNTERRAVELIAHSSYKNCIDNVFNVFF